MKPKNFEGRKTLRKLRAAAREQGKTPPVRRSELVDIRFRKGAKAQAEEWDRNNRKWREEGL